MNKLIPAIIQDVLTKDVLMLGYMNNEALTKTVRTGWIYFWSRKRKKLWMKGEKSGNKLKLKEIYFDCDRDAILIKAELIARNACLAGRQICHTGNKTCFYRNAIKTPEPKTTPGVTGI
jgi:phosphoribosyl-AMP cyclohydrolase